MSALFTTNKSLGRPAFPLAVRRQPLTAHLLALALAAAAVLPVTAGATGISFEGGGDYNTVPLYRAFVFGGIDRDGEGGFDFSDVDGVDYVSNTAPKSVASTHASFSANGATMTTNGWAAWSGFYAARTYASMTVNNANANDGYYLVAGQGSATSVRFYTPEAAAARATFTFHISGFDSKPANASAGLATGRVDFGATTETNKSWNDLFSGGLTTLFEYGAGTYTYSMPIADLGDEIRMYFWTSAFTEIKKGQVAQGSSFTMTADYGHTIVMDDVQLYDANDQAISEWTLQDTQLGQNVFNQDGRLADVLPAPAVPEPGTWALMLAGLGLVARLGRKSRAA